MEVARPGSESCSNPPEAPSHLTQEEQQSGPADRPPAGLALTAVRPSSRTPEKWSPAGCETAGLIARLANCQYSSPEARGGRSLDLVKENPHTPDHPITRSPDHLGFLGISPSEATAGGLDFVTVKPVGAGRGWSAAAAAERRPAMRRDPVPRSRSVKDSLRLRLARLRVAFWSERRWNLAPGSVELDV